MPLYFFAIGLGLIPVLNPVHGFTWRYATAFLLLAGNWSIVAWGWPLHTIVNPLWTVSVEEQFYLLWPPIVRTVSRTRVVFAAAAMFVVSLGMRIVMVAVHGGHESVLCNTLARLDPIAAGILIATTLRGRIPSFNMGLRLGMFCCGILPLSLVAHYWKIQSPESLAWVPTLAGFPVVAAGCALIMLAALGISARPPAVLVYLGKISYGLYVYHALGGFLVDKLAPAHAHFRQLVLREVLGLTVTILLAFASYTLLEKPFLQLKKRFELIRSRPV